VRVLDRPEDLDVLAALTAQVLEHVEVAGGGVGAARDDGTTRSGSEDTGGGDEANAERRDRRRGDGASIDDVVHRWPELGVRRHSLLMVQ
jgi:hypothetical protein